MGAGNSTALRTSTPTRVVQAIRRRRYVNQKEIAEALGIDQRRVSEALTRANDRRGRDQEVPRGGEGVTEGDGGPVRRGGQPGLLKGLPPRH